MFWYLSVINKPQPAVQSQKPQPIPPPQPLPLPEATDSIVETDRPAVKASEGESSHVEAVDDYNDDRPLALPQQPSQQAVLETPVATARLVTSSASRPDRTASLAASAPVQPLIVAKRTSARNEGFEVMHNRQPKDIGRKIASDTTSSRRAPSPSASRPKSQDSESSWLSSSERTRSVSASADSDAPEPISMPPTHQMETRNRPRAVSPIPASKTQSRPRLGTRSSSSAKLEAGQPKAVVQS